jgi:hypothetical protein
MPALGLSAVPEPMKMRMKSVIGLAVTAAVAEAETAATGTVPDPP